MTKVVAPKSPFAKRYDNYVGGEWRAPKAGKYFDNTSPITGQSVCEIARSDASDVEAALDAAHAAKDAWGRTSPTERAQILNKIADRMEANLDYRRGHPARHRPFPILRLGHPHAGRIDQRNRP
jgi:aldehyde dehydrogenase